MTKQLFSFDPIAHPACACPHCGWQTFWRHEHCQGGCPIQCEKCRRSLSEDDLVLAVGCACGGAIHVVCRPGWTPDPSRTPGLAPCLACREDKTHFHGTPLASGG